jgi:hypothetical protein
MPRKTIKNEFDVLKLLGNGMVKLIDGKITSQDMYALINSATTYTELVNLSLNKSRQDKITEQYSNSNNAKPKIIETSFSNHLDDYPDDFFADDEDELEDIDILKERERMERLKDLFNKRYKTD